MNPPPNRPPSSNTTTNSTTTTTTSIGSQQNNNTFLSPSDAYTKPNLSIISSSSSITANSTTSTSITTSTVSTSSGSSTKKTDDMNDIFPMMDGPQRAADKLNNVRRKVPLAPGHSPLDWQIFKTNSFNNGNNNNSSSSISSNSHSHTGTGLRRIPKSEMGLHTTREDCWMSIQGKVYNVTPYMKFHPGGPGQLMRGAGKDATELFFKVHPWVNPDRLLDKCWIGFLVSD